MTNTEKLAALNTFRAVENLPAIAAWRPARHQPMLDAYEAAQGEFGFGVNEPEVAEVKKPRGRNYKQATAETTEETPEVETVAEVIGNNDFANAAVAEAFAGVKQPAYKVLARQSADKSAVDSPVGFVHQFLAEHGKTLTRKEAVAALVAYGVNFSTARTQYQKWFSGK